GDAAADYEDIDSDVLGQSGERLDLRGIEPIGSRVHAKDYVFARRSGGIHSIKIFLARRRTCKPRGRFVFAIFASGSSKARTRSINSKSRFSIPRACSHR